MGEGELSLRESVENYPLGQREQDPHGDVFNRSTELNDPLLSTSAIITAVIAAAFNGLNAPRYN